MTRALAGAVVLTAALIPWQSTGPTARFPDRAGPYLGEKPPGLTPELFAPGLVSTGGFERDVAITPDGREIFFGLAGPSYQYTTVVSTRLVDGHWTEPEVVPGFDDPQYLHLEPALSADGRTLYFLSTRPDPNAGGTAGNQDIWMLTRTPDGWSAARNLGPPVNSALPEYFPSLTRDGTIYFTREEAGSRVSSIWRARPEGVGYRAPEKLPLQVNSGRSQFNAFVAPDESYVIVPTDGRPDSIGGCDYYVVFRTPDDRWSQPINLGPSVNTKGSQEFSPYVSPDGKYFFFMSSRPAAPERLTFRLFRDLHDRAGNGNADIYWADARLVTSLRAKAVFDQTDTIHGATVLGWSPAAVSAQAQQTITPDLKLLADEKGSQVFNRALTVVGEGNRTVARLDARAGDGGVLLDGILLGEGVIEVDLKGKDAAQQSFLGIAFHAVDWTTLDAVYFRPFNFRAGSAEQRSHSVQYVSHPASTWQRLRAERPGQFEQAIEPPPDPNGWFHARIVLAGGRVEVFVNGAAKPSLSVEDLGAPKSGGVALWVGNGSDGAFANLRITPTAPAGPPPASTQDIRASR